jgi:hypothetical protein
MNKKEKLLIIGAGMASGRMLEHMFETDQNRFDITLFGAEPRGNYNRIMLSPDGASVGCCGRLSAAEEAERPGNQNPLQSTDQRDPRPQFF